MNLLHTAHVPAGDGPFPTLFALHGWGAGGHDLLGLAPHLQSGRLLVICPQGQVEVPVGSGMTGYGWFPLVPGAPPDPVAFAKGSVALRDFVDAAIQAYPVDPERVLLSGFSQGGGMGYDLALRQPRRFRGLAALSTWLPAQLASAIPKQGETKGFPVLVQHGTEDPLVSLEKAKESVNHLRSFGADVTYHEYPMGHEIRPEGLRDLNAWIAGRLES